ncbi:hypothetical protein C900_02659 [Fulvivirga imtechensis AK7]|uniref:Uncharacterized protein n=1 Tax=Fulvivirga imtechensis AK7 TaxID=1237149 RepID=L8K0X3_9BACT|nr:hypothetical protein [Fulvivirga imtechensis]ELR73574.1 hypothetical protein C900_02659 [Fulvivirga imtechensis AK7]
MINFSLKRTSWNLRKAVTKSVDASYLKHFNQAVINWELNLQEERMKRSYNI